METLSETRGNYRWTLLAVVLSADLAFGSTMTVLGASLEQVSTDLGSSESALAWTVTAPFLAVAVGTPVFGKLGDLVGARRMFRIGLGVFAVATLASALATSAIVLILLRAVAGIGASMSLPNGLALILRVFTVVERPRALGWFHMVATGGPAVGLVTGGWLIDHIGWQIVFIIYGSIAAVGFVASLFVVRAVPSRGAEPIDAKGAGSLAIATVAGLFALYSIEDFGLASPVPYLLAVLSALAVWVFVRVERSTPNPLLPMRYLGERNFSAPLVANAALNGAYLGGLVLTPLILQDVFDFSLSAATSTLILRPAVFSISSPIGGRLVERLGTRLPAMGGGAAMIGSMSMFTLAAATETLALVFVGLALSGLALGLEAPSANTAIANTADEQDLGVANGFGSTASTLGGTLGLQLFLLFLGTADPHAAGDFVAGYGSGIALGVIGLLAASLMLRPTSADRTSVSAT